MRRLASCKVPLLFVVAALVSIGLAWVAFPTTFAMQQKESRKPDAEDDSPADAVRRESIVRKSYGMNPPHHSKDTSVKIDYDIVYVRAPHNKFVFPDVGTPTLVEPGADLMLLHPDGKKEVLVEGGTKGSVADPFVSFDGKAVYYTFFYASHGADVYKIHVPTRKITQLTHDGGQKSPHTRGATYAKHHDSQVHLMTMMGHHASVRDVIYNTGPCPVPGGKVVFTSNRHGFVPRLGSFTSHAFQLTSMDDDGSNVETIGHLNLGCALHPVILSDGRIMFSTLENQGLRSTLHWSIWTIRPDGSHWDPLVSDFGWGLPPSFHFQTQRTDGRAVVEFYYNVNQAGFGTFAQFSVQAPKGAPFFGPGDPDSPRNRPLRMLSGGVKEFQLPFSPPGFDVLTPFANDDDNPSPRSDPKDQKSPRVGRVTHPCGAPDNHLLTVWAPDLDVSRDGITGGVRRVGSDTGIYLIKAGQPVYEPGQMVLLENDPKFHEQWPRPLVPYKRIYGIDRPNSQILVVNDGKQSPHLPEGTPYGLIGTSSLYKRESATNGVVEKGSVTAVRPKETGRYRRNLSGWVDQGADAGLYDNSEIHAIRIVLQEPNVREDQWRFLNHAHERMRILGEIPVRHFTKDGKQPLDPDGNPDTSFLAKVPADHSFTFQTLDSNGMVLNMAQTWHQVRPGEVRNDCGGCHAHSQQPTPFEKTASAAKDYKVFDLTTKTPLLTAKKGDESKQQWDTKDETGLRYEKKLKDVEYWRDVRPILQRSCAACHSKDSRKPAGDLVLDDDEPVVSGSYRLPNLLPRTYKEVAHNPRYVQPLRARASMIAWRLFGQRTDGHPLDAPWYHTGKTPAKPVKLSPMPPPEAVAGTYVGPDDRKIKVAALSDEDRRTLIRWIDLGCSIDLRFDPQRSDPRTSPFTDRTLPTLTVTYPRPGVNEGPFSRIVVGMADAASGLDVSSFSVIADFDVDGPTAERELAGHFRQIAPGTWEMRLKKPIAALTRGKLTIQVADRERNVSRIERTFSVR